MRLNGVIDAMVLADSRRAANRQCTCTALCATFLATLFFCIMLGLAVNSSKMAHELVQHDVSTLGNIRLQVTDPDVEGDWPRQYEHDLDGVSRG